MGVVRGPRGGAPSLGRTEEGGMGRGGSGEVPWRPMDSDSQWENELGGALPPPPGPMWGPGGKGEGEGRVGPDGSMQG